MIEKAEPYPTIPGQALLTFNQSLLLCDEYGYDMVVEGNVGWRRIDIVVQFCVRKDKE